MFKGFAGSAKEKNAYGINDLPANNIELFDSYTGLILGRLYRNFPLPITITAEEFIDYKHLEDSNRQLLSQEENLFLATVKWLADVGYIHFDGMSGVSFFEVVLTSNGLLILRAFAEGEKDQSTLGAKLSQFTQGESTLELKALVTQALNLGSQLLKPMTRSGI
ncbi:hypothetical protein SB766_10120 [Pseudomonas sp. SIMBA_077]